MWDVHCGNGDRENSLLRPRLIMCYDVTLSRDVAKFGFCADLWTYFFPLDGTHVISGRCCSHCCSSTLSTWTAAASAGISLWCQKWLLDRGSEAARSGGSSLKLFWGHGAMASAVREPITRSGGGAPAGSRGRAPGQGVRGLKHF